MVILTDEEVRETLELVRSGKAAMLRADIPKNRLHLERDRVLRQVKAAAGGTRVTASVQKMDGTYRILVHRPLRAERQPRGLTARDQLVRELDRTTVRDLRAMALAVAEERGDEWVVGGPEDWSKDQLIAYVAKR